MKFVQHLNRCNKRKWKTRHACETFYLRLLLIILRASLFTNSIEKVRERGIIAEGFVVELPYSRIEIWVLFEKAGKALFRRQIQVDLVHK